MSIEIVKSITARSNEKLELARRYAMQAESLPQGDSKRLWLEEEAERLISEARSLSEEAREKVKKYK